MNQGNIEHVFEIGGGQPAAAGIAMPGRAAAPGAAAACGPAAAGFLDGLDVAGSDVDTLNGLSAVQRLASWTAATQARLLAELQQRQSALEAPGRAGRRWLSVEVGAVMRVSGGYACTRMLEAERLVTRLPGTLDALGAGVITPIQARTLNEVVDDLSAEAATIVESRVLPRAEEQTLSEFRSCAERAAMKADPGHARRARAQALAQRHVRRSPDQHGMSSVIASLPTPGALVVCSAINHLAEELKAAADAHADRVNSVDEHDCASEGCEPSSTSTLLGWCEARLIGQRRADALVELANRYLNAAADNPDHTPTTPTTNPTDPTNPTDTATDTAAETATDTAAEAATGAADAAGPTGGAGDDADAASTTTGTTGVPGAARVHGAAPAGAQSRLAPHIQVTVSLSTLLGADEHPGELAGYGPIPAEMARELAADPNSTWRRLVTDPLGRVIDYGRSTYRPPKQLADFVRARSRTCVFPNCRRSALDCELDHIDDWANGGHTNADNLAPTCPRHHHVKHDAGWTIHHDPDTGTYTWTSPTGRRYLNRPPELPGTEAVA